MGTIAKKRKYVIVAIVIIAVLAILTWILLSRPASQTAEGKVYSPIGVTGEYQPAVAGGELVKVAEDAKTILYFDQDTGGIVIEDVATGERVYSVPQDALDDARASKDIKKQTASAVLLNYYSISSQKEIVFDSYTNAVGLQQISWAPLSDGSGINVKMIMGRAESSLLIPEQISATRFNELQAQFESELGSSVARKVKALYLSYTYETANAEQRAKYPSLKDMDIYVLKSSSNDKNKKDLELYFNQIGYTYEQMALDYEELGYVSDTESFPCFKLSMDYRLVDGVVKVDLPVADIEYDRESFILSDITIFPFMGAGKTGEEGYLLLPDGSGSIVPFNNDGSAVTLLTSGRTYGPDAAESISDRGSAQNEFRYPVFGIKCGEHALFGVVTGGDAITKISCQLGNIAHSYNTAYPEFIVGQNATYDAATVEHVPWVQYDKKGYSGVISLEYHLLTGENADYSGMAAVYRDYIVGSHTASEVAFKDSVPLMLETLGTVGNTTRVLGVPGYRNVEATSYTEATRILQELKAKGVNQIALRYLAWCNGGYDNYPATDLDLEKAVGSKSDLKKLQETVAELGGELFMDVNFMTARNMKSFEPEYIQFDDGIRDLFQKQANYPVFQPARLMMAGRYICINPKKLLSYYDDVTSAYSKLGLTNISVGTVGEVLNSNYKKSDYLNRQDSEYISKELLRRADEQYNAVMVDAGNAYTFETADYILNLPTSNSNLLIEEQSVPFIQMALHGTVVYAGSPLNLAADFEDEVLRSIEYGCVPYFQLCDTEGAVLKNSWIDLDYLYNSLYSNWQDRVVDAYSKINTALADVQDDYMISHESLGGDLYVTEYSDGTQIYVNYSDAETEYDGVKIPAKDYAVVKKGASGHE